jgi:hypothetical protein
MCSAGGSASTQAGFVDRQVKMGAAAWDLW